jgi:hypothetical protein
MDVGVTALMTAYGELADDARATGTVIDPGACVVRIWYDLA